MLKMLKNMGYPMPEPESYDLVNKTQLFELMQQFQNEKHDDDGLLEDFMELVTYFPVSLCQRMMTENLKYLITLYYMFRVPQLTELSNKDIPEYEVNSIYQKNPKELERYLCDKIQQRMTQEGETWYSYEQLSLIFRRGKSSIFDAIRNKETEVKAIIDNVLMHRTAHRIALEEMVKEEKEKLKIEPK